MSIEVNHRKTFLGGAVLLSIAALITKIISAGYRIPYQNMTGDLGFYVYQQMYPFYGFMAIVSLYGFPVVLSRRLASANQRDARTDAAAYFVGLMMFSILAALFMIGAAPWLAISMGDPQLTGVLRITGFSFLFLPFLSVTRGISQGQGDMVPTAVSNVGEQLVRVSAILIITYLLMKSGADAYQFGTGAIYGSLLGSFTSVVILCLFLFKRGGSFGLTELKKLPILSGIRQSGHLLAQSVFICMNALVLIFFQFADVFTMIHLLEGFGMSEGQAYQVKGVFDRGQPFIQLGTILATTMALALVPAIAQAQANKNHTSALAYQDMALRLALLLGGAATIGLIIIMNPVNHMLFTDEQGSSVLRILVLSIAPCSIYLTTAAILQGYGKVRWPAFIILIGVVVKLIANVILIPVMGAMGSSLATTIAFVLMATLGLCFIKRAAGNIYTHFKPYGAIAGTFAALIIVATLSLWLLDGWIGMGQTRALDTVIALTVSVIGGLAVLICLFTLPIFTASEWEQVPKLNRLKRVFSSRKG
ncbi:putative polysaccharide biosynthesis protein [Alkalicoccobacillus porphyridii]|uniref:putative polysaccharide biosynthesis protein n=1 Tax=Alkalicoccobacillus porphyridii TaxID=2597270 RepID=UPI00163DD160|nr:polysaccharide biosynthesis protein [Alkalicoccobacillus porphyridii]